MYPGSGRAFGRSSPPTLDPTDASGPKRTY